MQAEEGGEQQQRGEEAALVAEKHASSEPAGATAEDGVSGSDDDGDGSIADNDDIGSSDESEEQLLSRRASLSSKHELPQPAAPARSRQNRFPKIPKSARCGKCENCLNPQRKKACIVARQRMLQQAGGTTSAATQSRSTPVSATAHATAPAPAAPAAGAPAAADPFTRNLTSILSSSGGVAQDRHLPLLLQLVKRARSKPHRTALLAVLQLSSPEVLRQAVAGGVLLELQAWLGDFVAEEKQAMVQRVLGCLNKLPVTLTALQPPCELGKVVGRLRKLESFGSPVIEPAKRLVARWKAMVDQAVKSGSQSDSAAAPASKAVAGEAGGRSAAAIAAAKPSAGVAAGAGLDRQSSGGAAGAGAMDDGDLFKSADRQRAGIKEAVPIVKKTVTIKTLPVEATRGLKPAAAGQPAAQQTAGAQADGPSGVPERANISKVSASPFASLGSMSSLGSGVTMLGSSSGGLHRVPLSTVGPSSSTAKDRAAAAARRVPSPEPGPCKEKKKKVVWVEEEVLTAVRWFRKDDPPAAAKADADLSKAGGGGDAAGNAGGGAAAREASPPGFESAAKQEHLSEAEALRRHREEENEERSELDNRLALMVPTTAWLNPLPNDTTSGAELDAMSAPPACGEDSAEAQAAAARHEQAPALRFDSLAAVPDCPAEPTTMAEHGVVQHLSTIPRIPLSLEEAATMRRQEAQQQISASQPPVQVPAQQQQQQQQHLGGGQTAAQQGLSQIQVQPRQQLPQQQPRQQTPPPGQGVADISAALAQLAASGILNAAKGGMPGRAAPEQEQQLQQIQQLAPPHQQQQQQGAPPAARPPPPGMPLPPPGPPPRGQPSALHGQRPPQQPLRGQPPPPLGPSHRAQHTSPHGQPPPLRGQPRPPPGMPPPGPPGPAWHPQIPPVQQRPVSGRPCRYFNTPQGCYMGDRCNFAHLLPPGSENERGGGASGKRPPDGDVGRPGKQQRGSSWGGGRP